jgi:hypothetical protein
MKINPKFYTHDYDPSKVLKVVDRYKQKLYISNGIYPCDIYVDSNNNLVMLFEKSTLT